MNIEFNSFGRSKSFPDLFDHSLLSQTTTSTEWHHPIFATPKRVYEESDTRRVRHCFEKHSPTHTPENSFPDLPGYTFEGAENDRLGKGTFGEVVCYEDETTHSPVAVKVGKVGEDSLNEARVLKLLAQCKIPNVLHKRAHFEIGEKSYLVTDLIPEASIEKLYLGSNPPEGLLKFDDIVAIAYQGLKILESIASHEIMHRDIKPRNMIWQKSERSLEIIDWGLAARKLTVGDPAKEGTPLYIAPEALLKGVVDGSSDLWSLGCTLFELFTNSYFLHLQGLSVDVNTHLHAIAAQIGLPNRYFLEGKCFVDVVNSYFVKETTIQFRNPLPFPKVEPWWDSIEKAGLHKGLRPDDTYLFCELLDGMLQYEGRKTPSELLKSPLFDNEVTFHLPSDKPPEGHISIFSLNDILSSKGPSIYINPCVRVHRSHYYLPRGECDLYAVQVQHNKNVFSNVVKITEGSTLHIDYNNQTITTQNFRLQ